MREDPCRDLVLDEVVPALSEVDSILLLLGYAARCWRCGAEGKPAGKESWVEEFRDYNTEGGGIYIVHSGLHRVRNTRFFRWIEVGHEVVVETIELTEQFLD